MPILIKRVYDAPSTTDGRRILVDRLWPRGLKREIAKIDDWLKEIAPSHELRKWFAHEPAKWPEFQQRYTTELSANSGPEVMAALAARASSETVTLVYAAKDSEHNNAVVLQSLIEEQLG